MPEFHIRRTSIGNVGVFIGDDGPHHKGPWANFPLFVLPSALDMKELLVRLIRECEAFEPSLESNDGMEEDADAANQD